MTRREKIDVLLNQLAWMIAYATDMEAMLKSLHNNIEVTKSRISDLQKSVAKTSKGKP